MKKLTLTEACLMEASGELGEKARAKLHEHVQKYPAALLEHEIARGNMALLRSLPNPELSEDEKKRIAGQIKTGIQKKLWHKKHLHQSKRRWKLIYQALATVSAAAAGLIIAMSIMYLQNEDARQRAAVARAEQVLDAYLASDELTAMEKRLHEVSDHIDALTNEAMATVGTGTGSNLAGFVSEWEMTTDEEMDFGPPVGL